MIFYNYPIKEKKLKNRKVLKYHFENYFTLCKMEYNFFRFIMSIY